MLPRIELATTPAQSRARPPRRCTGRRSDKLDQSETDPIDMAPGDRVGHMIFVQQFLHVRGPGRGRVHVRGAARRHAGLPRTDPRRGGAGTTGPMTVPDVGDDRYGDLTTMEGGRGGGAVVAAQLPGATGLGP